ncbi:MAG: hypothetical protein A07HB70_00464 [uncultured archaeon A07HB70]|nr:MAG: hypothetical protein A07HB70_00464 [uncultured archaeon A07HB70]
MGRPRTAAGSAWSSTPSAAGSGPRETVSSRIHSLWETPLPSGVSGVPLGGGPETTHQPLPSRRVRRTPAQSPSRPGTPVLGTTPLCACWRQPAPVCRPSTRAGSLRRTGRHTAPAEVKTVSWTRLAGASVGSAAGRSRRDTRRRSRAGRPEVPPGCATQGGANRSQTRRVPPGEDADPARRGRRSLASGRSGNE